MRRPQSREHGTWRKTATTARLEKDSAKIAGEVDVREEAVEVSARDRREERDCLIDRRGRIWV
jgi:hypothetical protein